MRYTCPVQINTWEGEVGRGKEVERTGALRRSLKGIENGHILRLTFTNHPHFRCVLLEGQAAGGGVGTASLGGTGALRSQQQQVPYGGKHTVFWSGSWYILAIGLDVFFFIVQNSAKIRDQGLRREWRQPFS